MSVPPEAASRHFDPILRPDPQRLYAARAARLRHLAEGHDLADYLRLAARIAEAQAAAINDLPIPATVDAARLARSGAWPEALDRIMQQADIEKPVVILAAMAEQERRDAALALAEGRFDAVDPAIAPFLWAALSLEATLAASTAALPANTAQEPRDCPLCGTTPVASVIHTGTRQGMRYLHCALCECEWHMVRAKCSDCGDAAALDYLSFDTPEAAVRAESCGACGGYLKLVSLERDPDAEVVADDLATLLLDDAAIGEGFGRSGFNPFALPAS